MIIDFDQRNKDLFRDVALKLQASPELYLDFESVADFYQACFLNDLPQGTVWTATGLDDGAEHFYAKIEYKNYSISISKTEKIEVNILLP